MLSTRNCRLLPAILFCGILGFLVPARSCGQGAGGISALSNAEIQNSLDRPLTLLVSVRETSGIPLSVPAIARLSALAGGQNLVAAVRENSTATFPNVRSGEYEVEVEAPGYQATTERVSVTGASTYTAYIYLAPIGATVDQNKPASGTVMTPDLQREVDRSFVALNQKKYDEARKHLEKAHKMAPANPDILYLIGLIDYTEKNVPAARKQFESVLATHPAHQRSLVMLGQMELDANENQEASLTLQKATDTGTVNWQAHYLLAIAYARIGELKKSRIECQRTSELNKDKKPAMDLLVAKIDLMEGKNLDAREAFEAFLRNYPQDSGGAEAKKYLARIEEAEKAATMKSASDTTAARPTATAPATVDAGAVPRAASDFSRPWAPPEVDAAIPPVAPGVGCSLNEVLEKTQKRILSQLSDLEKFGATEHIEHQFIDNYGVPETPVAQSFDYLIYVHHSAQLPYYFDEMRNGAESLYAFPTSLVTRGLVSLGFMVIHPVFSQDFQFTCEGLGTWQGQPAWQIHFAQRGDAPSRIRSWSYKKSIYPIPLKGRIWIGANSYNLLHLETGLRDPVQDLRLYREQLIVDYGPVKFKSSKTSLWLPSQADMYFDMQGRRYHHRHTLTDYVLFDVDTKNKISAPAEPPEPKEN
jgi:tetratricopeptide (TPR) repeat protein